MNWNDRMAENQKASENNDCRELTEVPTGSDYQIRKLMEEYPQFLWKYSEGSTIPGYVMKAAELLEKKYYRENNVPIDLYPCEYFRIMEHSMPTELALQPKRFDKAQEQLQQKLQTFYKSNVDDLRIPDRQLMPRIACAVCLQDEWYRGRLENTPTSGIWAYVYLVDVGKSRQVPKSDVHHLPLKFGHYPPMVVKATIRGAIVQRMDYERVDRFRELIKQLGYLARCQITTCTEPFHINMCHPNYEKLNVCSFLLAPLRGEPSEAGIWLPKKIAIDLKRENDPESDGNEDSGADSDYNDSDDEDNVSWDFDEETDDYLRSFPPSTKVFRVSEEGLQVERIENERLIFLTNNEMRDKRTEAEEYLSEVKDSLDVLPEVWQVFGTACAVFYEGVLKRAAIYGINGSSLKLLLVDSGIVFKSDASEVFSLPNETAVNMEPQVTLVSLSAFDSIHFSRVEILRQILPRGTSVRFEKNRKSKDTPTKGTIFLNDDIPVDQLVLEMITARNLDLECFDIVPYCESSHNPNHLLAHRIDPHFIYRCPSSIIYKKSKLVTSKF